MTATLVSLPFPAGRSPFHAKGVLYSGTAGFFAEHHPKGIAAVQEQIADPALRDFIGQRFLAGSWYDALPCAPLIQAEARALDLGVADYMRKRTRWQAERDLRGIYRVLLHFTSPATAGVRFAKVLGQYQDFGTTEAEVVEKGQLQVVRRGMPVLLFDWYSLAAMTYGPTVLEAAGAKGCQVVLRPREADGSRDGVDLCKVSLTITWT